MRNDMRIGAVLPTGSAQWGAGEHPRQLISAAAHVERLGYDSVWVNDTLIGSRIEPLTMLAAVAAATERVTLGTAALLPAFRRPVQAAQAIASLDLLAEGRLALTVGGGYPGRSEPEFAATEVPWVRRFARLDDTVGLWRRMWTSDGPVSFAGNVLHIDDIPPSTRPHRAGGPPIWLAGATPAALRRTGRHYDGWLPYPPDPADYATGLAAVREAAAGRAITPALFATVLVADSIQDGRDRLDAFCRAGYGFPLEVVETIQTMITGPVGHIAEQLEKYAAAGARHLVLRVAAPDIAAFTAQLELLTAVRPEKAT